MSHGLVPSKSTVYVSNLPFWLTNNDLYKIFEKCGKIVKITIVKNEQRKSKGIAFVLFLTVNDAKKCVSIFDKTQLFGRTLRVSIATDNGRSREFIKKRVYEDKSCCYECGEPGHLSYKCPRNGLGARDPPPKKLKKKKKAATYSNNLQRSVLESSDEEFYDESKINLKKENRCDIDINSSAEEEEPDLETLSAAIKIEAEQAESSSLHNEDTNSCNPENRAKKRIRKSTYFSDEEEMSE